MRISPAEYGDATRLAWGAVSVLCGVAGALAGFSTRHIKATGLREAALLLACLLILNVVVLFYQRLTLPRAERAVRAAIAQRDAPEFARHLLRQEIAKLLQPLGGLALSLGFVAEIIVYRLWR